MNRTTHPFIRLAVLATTALSLLLVTAGRAAARYPPDHVGQPSSGSGGLYQTPIPAPVEPVTEHSVSALQWVLFFAAVLGALAIGAALMHLAQRRHPQLAD